MGEFVTYVFKEIGKFPNLSILLICCICSLWWYKQMPPRFVLLTLYVWFALFIEVSSRWFSAYHQSNNFLFHGYSLGTFWILSFLYRTLLGDHFKNFFYYWLTVGTALIIANSVWLQPLNVLNTYSLTFLQIVVVWYSIAFAFRSIQGMPAAEEKALRWLNGGILLYHAASIFIFLPGFLIQYGQYKGMKYINITLLVVFYTTILYSLWKARRLPPTRSSSLG